jgi:hypothetical protein
MLMFKTEINDLSFGLIILLFWNLCVYGQRSEVEPMDCTPARKMQKADREKLRRDRLNEQFVELGNILGK